MDNKILMNVVTFQSTHHAIAGEKHIKEEGIAIKTIPTPREITASCGLSIKFELEDLERIQAIIAQNQLSIEGIYQIQLENEQKIALRLV